MAAARHITLELSHTQHDSIDPSGGNKVETRRALAEQLELGQQLRKKAGLDGSDEDEDGGSEEVSLWLAGWVTFSCAPTPKPRHVSMTSNVDSTNENRTTSSPRSGSGSARRGSRPGRPARSGRCWARWRGTGRGRRRRRRRGALIVVGLLVAVCGCGALEDKASPCVADIPDQSNAHAYTG